MSTKYVKEIGKELNYEGMADLLCGRSPDFGGNVYRELDYYKKKCAYLEEKDKKRDEEVALLKQEINSLKETVRMLVARIDKDSSNSGKPPSTDGFKKKNRSLREKSGKLPGAQKGHPGKTLMMSENPDKIVVHELKTCSGCGETLFHIAARGFERRQVFDIPPIKIEVTEHQAEIKNCPCCGKKNRASFPDEVPASVQFGHGVKSLVAYLSVYQFIPYGRIAEFFSNLFSHRISDGAIRNILAECHENLEGFEDVVKQQILDSPIVNFDETGITKKDWIFSASTDKLTYYYPARSRGLDSMDSMGILPDFANVAVHDGYAAYNRFDCIHALCNVHHLRELKGIIENGYESVKWPEHMQKFLKKAKKIADHWRERAYSIPINIIEHIVSIYENILKFALSEYPPEPPDHPGRKKKGRKKQKPSKNLLDRLLKNKSAALAFIYNLYVPFDNNLAERDIRMAKLKKKVSGTFRSQYGLKFFCRIRSYISTVKKNGQDILESIINAFHGKPFLPDNG